MGLVVLSSTSPAAGSTAGMSPTFGSTILISGFSLDAGMAKVVVTVGVFVGVGLAIGVGVAACRGGGEFMLTQPAV